MPAIPSTFIIESDGNYDYEGLVPGRKYVVEMVGTDGYIPPTSINILFRFEQGGVYYPASDNSLTADAPGRRFVAPARDIRFEANGVSDPTRIVLRDYV